MPRLYVRHAVTDYASWREGYDAFDRSSLGVTGAAVYQSVDDPNDVTVWHDFDSVDAARALADSSQLAAAMRAAGVVGKPEIWITNER